MLTECYVRIKFKTKKSCLGQRQLIRNHDNVVDKTNRLYEKLIVLSQDITNNVYIFYLNVTKTLSNY